MTSTAYRFPTPGRSKNLSKALYCYLQRSGLRMLNEEHRKAPLAEVPSVQVIEDLLWDLCRQKGDSVIAWYDPDSARITGSRSKLSHECVERLCHNAAEFIAETWDPGYLADRAIKGHNGARKRWATQALRPEELEPIAYMSRAQQAKHLGVSTDTVARARRAAKAERDKASANLHLLADLVAPINTAELHTEAGSAPINTPSAIMQESAPAPSNTAELRYERDYALTAEFNALPWEERWDLMSDHFRSVTSNECLDAELSVLLDEFGR